MMSKRILFIFILGVLYVLLLISFVRDEYFYSGDGGIKTLMIKEYIAGDLNKTFELQSPDWVQELWKQGLYPFRKPFVYETPEGMITGFPPYFSFVSAPFYKLFGYRGLYVIPALSVFLLWFLFIRLGSKLNLSEPTRVGGLIALIFASSLTLYGSIFWEHTLASLGCFVGLYFLLSTYPDSQQTRIPSVLCGLIAGLSVWLRPEALFILIFLMIFCFYLYTQNKKNAYLYFAAGSLLAIAGFFLTNYLLYGSVAGFHSKQVTEGLALADRIQKGVYTFAVLIAKAVLFDPISVFVVVAVVFLARNVFSDFRVKPTKEAVLLLGVLFFYAGSTWIFPNTGGLNWGIRYALVCIPFFYVLAMLLVEKVKAISAGKYLALLFWIMVAGGVLQDTVRGGKSIYNNYQGYKTEVMAYFREHPVPVVVISNSNHSAELEALMESSVFLLAEDREHLDIFLKTRESRETEFVLLHEPGDGYGKEGLTENDLKDFQPVKKIGNLTIYKYKPGQTLLLN